MMNTSNSVPSTVKSISFSFLSTRDVRRISVKRIVNPVLLDDLNRPNIDGLYDPALGPSDQRDMYTYATVLHVRSEAYQNVDVRHVGSITLRALDTLVTLNLRPRCSILYSC